MTSCYTTKLSLGLFPLPHHLQYLIRLEPDYTKIVCVLSPFTAYFPLGPGNFSVIYYIGGLSSLVPAEAYSIFLSKLASHGFFVFGVDYYFPLSKGDNVGADIDIYLEELAFVSCDIFLLLLGTKCLILVFLFLVLKFLNV